MIKHLLYLSILTTFAVASWLGFNIYHNITNSTVSTSTNVKIVPISPVFDIKTLQTLKKRIIIPANLTEKTIRIASSSAQQIPQLPISATPIQTATSSTGLNNTRL